MVATKSPGAEVQLIFGMMPATIMLALSALTMISVSLVTRPPSEATIARFLPAKARAAGSSADNQASTAEPLPSEKITTALSSAPSGYVIGMALKRRDSRWNSPISPRHRLPRRPRLRFRLRVGL